MVLVRYFVGPACVLHPLRHVLQPTHERHGVRLVVRVLELRTGVLLGIVGQRDGRDERVLAPFAIDGNGA